MSDLDGAIKENHSALDEFVKGNPEPVQKLYSRRQDVALANPFGTVVHGHEAVISALARAASQFRDGNLAGFENIATYEAGDLACIVEVERYVAKFGGREKAQPLALRATSIFRREDGVWRLILRHADPRVELQPLESVFPK